MPPKNNNNAKQIDNLVFDGIPMIATKKPLRAQNKIMKLTMITKKTYDDIISLGDNAEMEELNYVKIKRWIEQNKTIFFEGHNRVQINILTSKGWRSGKAFNVNEPISWYSAKAQYQEALYDITTVYAVQFLLF